MPVTSQLLNHAAAEGHGRTGGVTADAEDDRGLELANEALAGGDAAGQIEECAEARGEGYIFERANVDETKVEAGLGNEANLHAARGADKQHLGRVTIDEFVRHRERRDDVAAGAAAGNKDA